MTTVRKLLEAKASPTNFSVEADQTVLDALKVMAEAKNRRHSGDREWKDHWDFY